VANVNLPKTEGVFNAQKKLFWTGMAWRHIDVKKNTMQYIELLTNEYRLNPKPRMILIVEGESEYIQIPRLIGDIFGYSISNLGIELYNLEGIGNFVGSKKFDKYGALEKYIDYFHSKQTIVFSILDNENKAKQVMEKLIKKPSKSSKKRTVTKAEFFKLWEKNLEFDNFSDEEIAVAMAKLTENKNSFESEKILAARNSHGQKRGGASLEKYFEQKTGRRLDKPKLFEKLCDGIIQNGANEFDKDKNPKREILKVLRKIITIAARNYQPVTMDIMHTVQESDYLGNPIK
jgi:hypothetical protein